MPMLNLKCSKPVPDELLEELSSAIAETIGKPEKYVMVVVDSADILMSGEKGDAAYAEVKSIGGLDRVVNHELTIKICITFISSSTNRVPAHTVIPSSCVVDMIR